jgi:hypothetical protein
MKMVLQQRSMGILLDTLITDDYEIAKKFYINNTNSNSCVCLYLKNSRILFPASDKFFKVGFHNKAQSNYKIIQKGNRKRD